MSLTLRQICLVAEKLQPAIEDLKTVLGLEVCFIDPGVEIFGLENSLMPVGTNFIEVVAPVRDNTAGGRYLQRRGGNGGYMVITQAQSAEAHAALRARVDRMGVRVAWEMPHDTVHYMQLHPADTGGTFFQIDWDTENEHQGQWVPAGGRAWREFVRTDVVTAITAAEIQSPDPESLARRWSAIADIPLRTSAAGHLEMPLSNAVVRFVPETDGRGEGLGGIDVKVADRSRLLEAARARGLTALDDQVTICGTRFNLV
ncbi:MAG: VOC family protein [Proteobacteria bacterium]|nr:VOC family protein [Pseudomonadota bacterium]